MYLNLLELHLALVNVTTLILHTISRSSSIQDILPPFPVVKNPDNFIITFDVNFTTQVLTRFKKSKHQQERITQDKSLGCISINQERLKED
jgi:hypothetical protein